MIVYLPVQVFEIKQLAFIMRTMLENKNSIVKNTSIHKKMNRVMPPHISLVSQQKPFMRPDPIVLCICRIRIVKNIIEETTNNPMNAIMA